MSRGMCLAAAAALLAGCGSDGPTFTGVTIPPGIAVAMSDHITVRQGMSAQTTVTVARLSGYTGNVDLTLENLPTGVTAVFAPASVAVPSTSSTLTVTATGTAALGSFAVVFVGRAPVPSNATMQVTLTVAP